MSPVIVDPITQAVRVQVNPAQSVEVEIGTLGPIGISIVLSTVVTGSAYTFALPDIGTVVEGNSSSAQTFTIPTHLAQPFPIGSVLEVFQVGTGLITIAGSAGVTLLTPSTDVSAGQYATIGLRQRVINEWVLAGDLA